MTQRFVNRFRRPFSVTSCVMASVLLVACGGGESSGDSRLSETLPYSKQSNANESFQATPGADPNAQATPGQATPGQAGSISTGSSLDQQANNIDTRPTANNPGSDDEAGGTAGNNAGSNDGASKGPVDDVVDTGGELVEKGEDAATNEEFWEGPVARVTGQVTLEWYPPQSRENGDTLRDGEVGGYELRFRKAGADDFEHVILEGEWTVEHELTNLRGDYQFAIAAYDVNGLYSDFVSITPES